MRDWHGLVSQPWTNILLVLASLVCGGIIGIEMEQRHEAVGSRTLGLVSLGSAVFMMMTAALDYRTPVAAQVVSGIGFLGAGVILRGPYGISGLTSAATIWATAAIGMTVGLGYVGAGVALSLLLLAFMLAASAWERRHLASCRYQRTVLVFRTNGGKTLVKIEQALDEFRFPKSDYELIPAGDSSEETGTGEPSRRQMRLRYCDLHRRHREFLAYFGPDGGNRGNSPGATGDSWTDVNSNRSPGEFYLFRWRKTSGDMAKASETLRVPPHVYIDSSW